MYPDVGKYLLDFKAATVGSENIFKACATFCRSTRLGYKPILLSILKV